jgi:phosphatidate cytidylyltransferase
MLATRVITAVVALVVLLAMLFLASRTVWALFALAIALVACWEWSRMCGLGPSGRNVFLALSAAIGAVPWLVYVAGAPSDFARLALAVLSLAALFWIAVAPLWIVRLLRPPPVVRALAGWVVFWPAWFAFVVLRESGPWLLLAAAALVWVADIAAYFVGRRFGRHKLAPTVSPGKTWEGFVGALAGVALYGIVLAAIARDLPQPFLEVFEPALGLPAIVAMVVLAMLSVVGDLFESWMKRGAGMKDSSALLPGHGGLVDRIDSLTSTLPIVALALLVWR